MLGNASQGILKDCFWAVRKLFRVLSLTLEGHNAISAVPGWVHQIST